MNVSASPPGEGEQFSYLALLEKLLVAAAK
jgi:hypothetical protein